MLFLIWFTGCKSAVSDTNQGKERKPPLVKALSAREDTIAQLLETTGEVVATKAVTIRATVEGPIVFCPWREGDRVEKAGQKIIEINRPLYQEEVKVAAAALAVARTKLEDLKAGTRPEEIAQAKESVKRLEECAGFTKSDMERIAKLVESGGLAGEDVEKARVAYVKCRTDLASALQRLGMVEAGPTKTAVAIQDALVKEAAAKLSLAEAMLSECTINAPFAGIINRVYVRPGDLATAKAPFLEMFEASSLMIRFAVPESEATTVHKGMNAVVVLDAYPDRTFNATIRRVYPELDRVTRTRTVEATLRDDATLAPGMFARVSILMKTVENAVVLPDSAILTTPQGDKVVFVVTNNTALMKKVKIGIEQGHSVQLLEGVKPDEIVVVTGNENLKNGMKVRIPKAKEPGEVVKSEDKFQ